MVTPPYPNQKSGQQSVDQLALAALAAYEAGDHATCDYLITVANCSDQIKQLIWAAANEDMTKLAALVPDAAPSSALSFARHVFHTKERVPNRADLLPRIEEDLRIAATSQPPLLLAKLRYLHLLLARGADVSSLLADIQTFPLNARDAELLAIILHGGGRTSAAIALLNRMLQQITEPTDQQIIANTLAILLDKDGKPDIAAQLRLMVPAPVNELLQQWQRPITTTGNSATVVITTNISPKFVYNQASAPPNDAMIRQTLDSFYGQLQGPLDWPVIIFFDEPRDAALTAQADAYREKLQRVAADYNAQLHCRHGHGLRRNFIEAMGMVDTPYYFFLEHDWTFSTDAPPVTVLMDTLQAHPDLNVIRYNYNFNHLQRHDYALLPYATTTGLPLLSGAYYCNNPALVRTEKMKRDWLPLLTDPKYDAHNGGAGGAEEAIYLNMLRLVRDCGILPVADAMGCAITGTPGNTPRAIHNGI